MRCLDPSLSTVRRARKSVSEHPRRTDSIGQSERPCHKVIAYFGGCPHITRAYHADLRTTATPSPFSSPTGTIKRPFRLEREYHAFAKVYTGRGYQTTTSPSSLLRIRPLKRPVGLEHFDHPVRLDLKVLKWRRELVVRRVVVAGVVVGDPGIDVSLQSPVSSDTKRSAYPDSASRNAKLTAVAAIPSALVRS